MAYKHSSQARLLGIDKARRQEKMARLVGGHDASEKQWNYLRHLLQTNKRCQVIRYVEFANQLPSTAGTLDRFEFRKVFLSSRYFIRAINMAKNGFNDLTTATAELAASFGMTEAELLEAETFDSFANLPPMPGNLL